MNNHRKESRRAPNRKVYKHILANGGFAKFDSVQLEAGNFTAHEIRIREEHYRVLHRAPLNSVRCSRGSQSRAEYLVEWWEKNRAATYAHGRQKVRCECGTYFARWNRVKHVKTRRHNDHIAIMQLRQRVEELLNRS